VQRKGEEFTGNLIMLFGRDCHFKYGDLSFLRKGVPKDWRITPMSQLSGFF
jgi:hypothetical protein